MSVNLPALRKVQFPHTLFSLCFLKALVQLPRCAAACCAALCCGALRLSTHLT